MSEEDAKKFLDTLVELSKEWKSDIKIVVRENGNCEIGTPDGTELVFTNTAQGAVFITEWTR